MVSVRASLTEDVLLSAGAADVEAVPGPTSGNFCLKVAYRSSVGFCEFVLPIPSSQHRRAGLSNSSSGASIREAGEHEIGTGETDRLRNI